MRTQEVVREKHFKSHPSAMNLIYEIGDVRIFKYPAQLTSSAGLDIIEYSSGGKERKYKIAKQGNSQIRASIVEASKLIVKTKLRRIGGDKLRIRQPTAPFHSRK